jgi:dihydroorotate dehydrogenase electron transfer subunit
LRFVAGAARAAEVSCQVALERPLTCATGLCQGCPVPVRDDAGDPHLVRACVDGPVFRAGRVDWDRLADPGEPATPDGLVNDAARSQARA